MGMLGTLMALTLLGGAVLIGYTYRIEDLFLEVTEKELLAYQSAEALATSLVNQKGFVSYYFMDGDPDWLRQLGEYRQIFKGRLKEARIYSEDENERSLLDTIARENRRFVQTQDIVISHYEAGQRKAGETLHHEARKDFFQILEHCAFYKDLRKEKIMGAKEANQALARRLRISAVSGIMAFLLVGFLLAAFLIREILQPIRRLALETGEPEQSVGSKNVVQSLSLRIHDLVQDYNQTSVHLEKSRAHLLQAEKMAMVGKLAAGMAHSIRNPFTSVQMRLFSLKRSLEMDPVQQEDFDVIAEEIQHIDTIVQNFLEFSRTPKMKIQTVSPSTIVDNTLQLLKHRLNSYDVTVKLTREEPLPKVQADSEQIVAHVHGVRHAECHPYGRPVSPHGVAVLQVVVDEEHVVHDLDGGGEVEGVVALAAQALAGQHADGRAYALAAAVQVVPDRRREVVLTLARDQLLQNGIDAGAGRGKPLGQVVYGAFRHPGHPPIPRRGTPRAAPAPRRLPRCWTSRHRRRP